jgi:DNA-binding NarL/FixJ family response regulator
LRDILEPSFEVVAEAGDGNEAVERALAFRPDVVLMDVNLRGMDGIAATWRIKLATPSVNVVIISATDYDRDVYESIQAGATGYIMKSDSAGAILQSVRNASEGKPYLPPDITKRVLDGMANSMAGRKDAFGKASCHLTSRELMVVRLMAEGLRQKQIAGELFVSTRTVGHDLASIYEKLGINSWAAAITYAVRKGLVSIQIEPARAASEAVRLQATR